MSCKNNKGVTLVELLVSLVISALVALMVIGFMNAGVKSYSEQNDEVNMQMEAQTVTNQLEEMMIEADYVELRQVSPDIKALVIYYSDNICTVFCDNTKHNLYLKDELSLADINDIGGIVYTDQENLMAMDVSDLQLITSKNDMLKKNVIEFSLVFGNKTKTFKMTGNVTFRNKIKVPV